MKVFVLDTNKRPQDPVHPAEAGLLLNQQKAAVFKRFPFTIMELVRFDMQFMENPGISGVEYQQGCLAGYEVKEYLLEKWGRACVYCGKKDTPLEVEHIVPKSRGGSNRISNLTISCVACNQKKNAQSIDQFLTRRPELLEKIKAQAKRPLKDAAAVNATRWNLFHTLKKTGLSVEVGSGGLTKFNRIQRGFLAYFL